MSAADQIRAAKAAGGRPRKRLVRANKGWQRGNHVAPHCRRRQRRRLRTRFQLIRSIWFKFALGKHTNLLLLSPLAPNCHLETDLLARLFSRLFDKTYPSARAPICSLDFARPAASNKVSRRLPAQTQSAPFGADGQRAKQRGEKCAKELSHLGLINCVAHACAQL